MDNRSRQLHALLFAEGGALSFKTLQKRLECSPEELEAALVTLKEKLAGTGLTIVTSDTEAVLAISPECTDILSRAAREENARDIGDAGLEVLGILLYEGPSTRATIDYIRGVQSQSSIRNLLIRGLVERTGNPDDGREFVYRVTTDALAHLGASERNSLPEYATISRELAAFKAGGENHGGNQVGQHEQ